MIISVECSHELHDSCRYEDCGCECHGPEDDGDCICEFPSRCGGLGMLYCDGCGGDQCICICGGESECFGCPDCEGNDDYDFEYER
jgi:hypothetical protein